MSEAIKIRHAETRDLPAISDLATQWAEEGSTIGQEAGTFQHYLEKSGFLIVAEAGREIIGFLAADTKTQYLAVFKSRKPYVELEELYVVPGRRGRGIGSLLIDELKAAAKVKGLARYHVYSASRELEAVTAFYRKHGFQVWSIQAYADEQES